MAGMKSGSWCRRNPHRGDRECEAVLRELLRLKFTDIPQLSYTLYDAGDGEVGGGCGTAAACRGRS